MNKLLCFCLKAKLLNQENYYTDKTSLILPYLHAHEYDKSVTHEHWWKTDHYFVLACDDELEGCQIETLNFLFRKTNLYLSKTDIRKILNQTPDFLTLVNQKYEKYGRIEFVYFDLKLPAIEPQL